jgi:hypothetical protein
VKSAAKQGKQNFMLIVLVNTIGLSSEVNKKNSKPHISNHGIASTQDGRNNRSKHIVI